MSEALRRVAETLHTARNQGNERERERRIAPAFARCFAGPDGVRVLSHLMEITLCRSLGPGADAAALRHLEGQRQLVLRITGLIDRGHGGDDRA